MIKKIYCIYSIADKDSTLFTAENDEVLVDTIFDFILDNEEYDDFFDESGRIRLNSSNISHFYDILSEYRLYCLGDFDSLDIKVVIKDNSYIDIRSLVEAMDRKISGVKI